MKSLVNIVKQDFLSDDEMATAETEVYLIQATIASKFNVSIDSVDLVTADDAGNLRVRYATILLTGKDVRRIMDNGEN